MRRRDILKMLGAGLGVAAASPALASPVSSFFPDFEPNELTPSGPSSSLMDPPSTSHASSSRRLILVYTHSDEYFEGEYWSDGVYNQRALSYINHLMRDRHHGGVETSIDTDLLDLLHDFNLEMGNTRPIYLVSGYRQPYSSAGVSKKKKKNKGRAAPRRVRYGRRAPSNTSMHAFGKAIDLKMDNTTMSHARSVAVSMGRGGVGYYGEHSHLHLDVGPVRTW